MSNAKIFIESNSAPAKAHCGNYDAISKYNALRALEMQKKADEEFFRSFLLSVVVRHSSGEQFDLEKEFNEKFSQI